MNSAGQAYEGIVRLKRDAVESLWQAVQLYGKLVQLILYGVDSEGGGQFAPPLGGATR